MDDTHTHTINVSTLRSNLIYVALHKNNKCDLHTNVKM